MTADTNAPTDATQEAFFGGTNAYRDEGAAADRAFYLEAYNGGPMVLRKPRHPIDRDVATTFLTAMHHDAGPHQYQAFDGDKPNE